jgi:hypothetical protein
VIRRAALVIAGAVALAPAAYAGPSEPAPSPPDPRAQEQASEANLQSIAPRAGLTFSAALGGGMVLGKSVGRGPAASFRLGHVATSSTILTLELTGGTALHGQGGQTFHDDDFSLMAGGQHYTSPSLWIRGAAGGGVYTTDQPAPMGRTAHPQVSAVFGAGLDLARWRYLVLGLEVFSVASINREGLLVSSGFCLGLSYY